MLVWEISVYEGEEGKGLRIRALLSALVQL